MGSFLSMLSPPCESAQAIQTLQDRVAYTTDIHTSQLWRVKGKGSRCQVIGLWARALFLDCRWQLCECPHMAFRGLCIWQDRQHKVTFLPISYLFVSAFLRQVSLCSPSRPEAHCTDRLALNSQRSSCLDLPSVRNLGIRRYDPVPAIFSHTDIRTIWSGVHFYDFFLREMLLFLF